MTAPDNITNANENTPEKEQGTDPSSPNLSPNAMVQAAVASAIQEQKRSQQEKVTDDNAKTTKRPRRQDDDKSKELKDIWTRLDDREQAIRETRHFVAKLMDEINRDGLMATQELEWVQQKLKVEQEDRVVKTREIERLRRSEEKSRKSIANLLRAVETSNEETKDRSQAKLVEARMRADVLHMTSQRDQARNGMAESQRRWKLVEDELTQTKSKLSKVQQEKMQVERDQRATLSLAKSLQGNVHSDVDYYKRKVTELNTHVQGLSAVLTEKNRQIEELRRQMERNMSQNRLAAYRSDDRKKRASY